MSDSGKKGVPTPKRKSQEQINKQPIINPDKKAAKKAEKENLAKIRALRNQALETGEDRYLPTRDQGPVRRAARDFVDSHTSIGEFFIFITLGLIFLYMVFSKINGYIAVYSVLIMYIGLIIMILEAWLKSRTLKKFLTLKFGKENIPKGTIWYGVNRSFQIRKSRLPKPQVKRGEFPL